MVDSTWMPEVILAVLCVQLRNKMLQGILLPVKYVNVLCNCAAGRKKARATVTIRGHGKGRVTVNGQDMLDYFPRIADRYTMINLLVTSYYSFNLWLRKS